MFGEGKGGSGCAKPKYFVEKEKQVVRQQHIWDKKKISLFYWGVYVTEWNIGGSHFFPINFIHFDRGSYYPSFLDEDA